MMLAVLLTVLFLQAIAKQRGWPDVPWLAPWLSPLSYLPSGLQLAFAISALWLIYAVLYAWLSPWPIWLWLMHSALLYSAMGPVGRLVLVLEGKLFKGVMLDKGPKALLLLDQWCWYLLFPLMSYSFFSVPGLLLIMLLQQGRLAHAWRLRRVIMAMAAWPLYRFLQLPQRPMLPIVQHLYLLASEAALQPGRLYARLQQGRWWLWGLACGIGLLKMLL